MKKFFRYIVLVLSFFAMLFSHSARTAEETSDKSVHPAPFKSAGLASWYGPRFFGRQMANGERYMQSSMIVAHRTLPLNSCVRVTNLKNGRSAKARVADRGPYAHPSMRIIDLSDAMARELRTKHDGVVPVFVVSVGC